MNAYEQVDELIRESRVHDAYRAGMQAGAAALIKATTRPHLLMGRRFTVTINWIDAEPDMDFLMRWADDATTRGRGYEPREDT